MTDTIETKAIEPIKLGTIDATTPDDVISKATYMAKRLAKIINNQHLYTIIRKKKYVNVEGWNTLGAMMGILPREVSVVEHDNGDFEAVVELIRASDGHVVGRASGIVGADEETWQKRPRFARRSMCVTRSTGKAFRLGFSWIMKLAGYEPTPAEEMPEVIEGTFSEQPEEPEMVEEAIRDAGPVLPTNGYDFKTRPYNGKTLKAALVKKAEKYAGYDASDKQRNLLGALLSEYFQDDTKRYATSRWLFGAASTKEIDGAMVKAALDWLSPAKDDGGGYAIDKVAKTELGIAHTASLEAGGQSALL